jgi:hypothetical protein
VKRADIRAGVVYAYKPGIYDALRPVLILDAAYWARQTDRRSGESPSDVPTFKSHAAIAEEYRAAGRTYKPDDRYTGGDMYPDRGLAGLDFERSTRLNDLNAQDANANRLKALVKRHRVPGLLARFTALTRPSVALKDPKGLRAHLLNPSWITGEWDEVVGVRLAEEERRANIEAMLRAESEDRVSRAAKRVEALRALGLPGEIADAQETAGRSWRSTSAWERWKPPVYHGNTGQVTLTMRQVDALLTLIPDGALWREQDVEEDGWTLSKPEYDEDDDEDVDE